MKNNTYWIAAAVLFTMPWCAWADEAPNKPNIIQCARVFYDQNQTDTCYATGFLTAIEKITTIRTHKRFVHVKLGSPALYRYPFAVMTGHGAFTLTSMQRKALGQYLTSGGFLVASAGCNDVDWANSFQAACKAMFARLKLEEIAPDHAIYRTVYRIRSLTMLRPGRKAALQALTIEGRIVLIFSAQGINATDRAGGPCCCCSGNEIKNARQINVNLLAYALAH